MLTQGYRPQSIWLRSIVVILIISFWLPNGTAVAGTFTQGEDVQIYAKQMPANGIRTLGAGTPAFSPATPMNLIQDSSFESSYGGAGYWAQSSTNFGTPLCTLGDCNNGGGTAGPRTGNVWAWFGGVPQNEFAAVTQSVFFPKTSCGATLQFYLWIGSAQSGSDSNDKFYVTVDNTTVFSTNATQKASYSSYKLVSVNVGAFANGASHVIGFKSNTSTQLVTFNLDDISLTSGCTISGNAGTGGVRLTYYDGDAFTTTSKADGTYSIKVTAGWSGTINVSHPCYTLSATSRDYANVSANITGQNYTATFDPTRASIKSIGVFRPSNGVIFLKNCNADGYADIAINYGLAGDYPVVGDWEGDGDDTIGVYRNGTFLLRNDNSKGYADVSVTFGQPGDQPIAGDWDGNGSVTIGLFRPSTAEFLLRNSLTPGDPDVTFKLGNPGDIAIAGDWDGDGTDTVGVFRPTNGYIYLKNTNVTGYADIFFHYGMAGDKPVAGDWNNDGIDSVGIFRQGTFYLRNSNTTGFADLTISLGLPTDMPIIGNWDGLP